VVDQNIRINARASPDGFESLIARHQQPRFMNQRSRLQDGLTALTAQSGPAQ
jgi:hypothetical protein